MRSFDNWLESITPGLLKIWPRVLMWTGLSLFIGTCIFSDRLPLESLFVGPLLMLSGAIIQALS